MSYAVILSKPQDVLVKELFNYFNAESYDISHLSLVDAPVAQEGPYNTYQRIAITPHPEGVDVGTAIIHFNRIDLSTLFSVVEVKLREVDIRTDGSFDEALVLQEVQRKYGINTSTGQFGLTQVEGQDVFYAKVSNAAFIGYSPLVVELSLESRVDMVLLNGFNWTGFVEVPGSTVPIASDSSLTGTDLYFGQVAASELIDMTTLSAEIGLSDVGVLTTAVGTSLETWHKFQLDGKTMFVPQCTLRTNISWNQIQAANLHEGMVVTINGVDYLVRSMTGAEADPSTLTNTSTHVIVGLETNSEWDRTIGRISGTGSAVWGTIPDEGLQLNLGGGSSTWCKETLAGNSGYAVARGSSRGAGAILGRVKSQYNVVYRMWRPVLELIED